MTKKDWNVLGKEQDDSGKRLEIILVFSTYGIFTSMIISLSLMLEIVLVA